ncbi:MAG: hypothetical protein ABI091_03290, partial [Ferruginibacter sp.]
LRTNEDKLNFLAVTFKNEYLFPANLKRYGSHLEVFKQWIQGLPSSFSIVSYNYEIIDLAKEWGSLPQNATDSEENKIIANYFHFIASKTFQLMKKYKVLPY